jgi:subtilisin family serine protease
MHRSTPAVPARLVLPMIALALSACADQPTAPTRALTPSSLSASVVAKASPAAGSYLVLARGDNFSKDFTAKVAALGGKVRSMHNGSGLAVVTGLTPAAAQSLSAVSGVSEVDADDIVSLGATPSGAVADALHVMSATPQIDPTQALLFSWQWNMRDISAPAAWAAGKLGSKRVTAAILDTGADYDGIDLDGLVDLKRSISLTAFDDTLLAKFPDRLPFTDFNEHGTNVASQVSSNAIVFAGVTAKTTLMIVKVLGQDGSGLTSDVLNGVLYAADNGADVANLSLGGAFARTGNRRFINIIKRVMDYARRKGMLVVVAAGNAGTDLDHNGDEFDAYCDLQHVMCVSAVGPLTPTGNPDHFASYSNFGRAVDVAAPGGDQGKVLANWPWTNFFAPGVFGPDNTSWVWHVCSKTAIFVDPDTQQTSMPCTDGGSIDAFVGTSQATPHVTGLAASMIAQYGKNMPTLIRLLIEASADDLGPRGKDPRYGWGRINAARALGVRPLTH